MPEPRGVVGASWDGLMDYIPVTSITSARTLLATRVGRLLVTTRSHGAFRRTIILCGIGRSAIDLGGYTGS
jgi:hypothetical protein